MNFFVKACAYVSGMLRYLGRVVAAAVALTSNMYAYGETSLHIEFVEFISSFKKVPNRAKKTNLEHEFFCQSLCLRLRDAALPASLP